MYMYMNRNVVLGQIGTSLTCLQCECIQSVNKAVRLVFRPATWLLTLEIQLVILACEI